MIEFLGLLVIMLICIIWYNSSIMTYRYRLLELFVTEDKNLLNILGAKNIILIPHISNTGIIYHKVVLKHFILKTSIGSLEERDGKYNFSLRSEHGGLFLCRSYDSMLEFLNSAELTDIVEKVKTGKDHQKALIFYKRIIKNED